MSTKCTIAYGKEFHLYHECWENDCVYLRLDANPKFEVSPNSVTVRIPAHIWEVIRTFPGVTLDLAGKSDADLRTMVEQEVSKRIADWRKARSKREKGFISFCGALAYGPADTSRAKQIRSGVEHLTRERDLQRSIQLKIRRLAWENSPEGSRKRLKQHNRRAARYRALRRKKRAKSDSKTGLQLQRVNDIHRKAVA